MAVNVREMSSDDQTGTAHKRRRTTAPIPGAAPLRQTLDKRGRFKTPRRAPPTRTGILSIAEKECIIRCVSNLRDGKFYTRKLGRFKPCAPQESIAELFGLSAATVKQLCSQYESTGVVGNGVGKGNAEGSHKLGLDAFYGHHRLKQILELACIESAADDIRMTYNQMVRVAKEKLPEHPDHPITYPAIRRWAKRNGYIWTSHLRSRKMTLASTEKAQAAAATFSRKFMEIPVETPKIYTDESYLNQYHSSSFAVANAANPSTMPHATRKGKRLCFATAIAKGVGELGCRWIFCPNKSEAAKKDYHASFNRANYLNWFINNLIPAINAAFPNQSCVIIMDNASYHVAGTAQVTLDDGSVKKVTKQSSKLTLMRWINANSDRNLTQQEIDLMFQAELVQMYQEILLGLGNDIERVARTNNHTVLFTPPRKSEWQPIEKYWAVVKNDVARKYTKNRTFPQVRQQLEAVMDHFGSGSADGSDTCSRIIVKTEQSIQLYYETLRAAEARADARRLREVAENTLWHVSSSDADDWGYSDSSDADLIQIDDNFL